MARDIEGNRDEALRFLRWLRPDGPWVLTAIRPDTSEIETRTFALGDVSALSLWLGNRNGTHNLYVMVNPARTVLTKKASKEDVDSLEFLHVDVDPPKDPKQDLNASRAEILKRLQAFDPPPSAIVDSGGGYQGFWRLKEPLYLGGDAIRWEEAEAYNQQLETVLKGDHCFNCDRIMRLPGTINVPDRKKRAAGRIERVASIVGELSDVAYPLDRFTAASRSQSARSSAPVAAAPPVQISGNLAPVLVDDLPETVPQRIKMLIVQGCDPDEPTKYGSRSEVSWAVTCGLLRAGCDHDTVASILLDPDYAVSAHVLAQRRPAEYVVRQIGRAREEIEEPWLRVLNEKHAVIADMGGKCRIISETVDHSVKPPRPRISKQSFEDFRNRYMNQTVVVGKDEDDKPIKKQVGNWWLTHPMRRQYDTIVFAPNQTVENAYNLWQGFACEAIPGRNHEPYLEHIRDNICGGNEEHYAYLIGWMARGVQHPDQQGEVAVVLRGGRGAGKGTVASVYGSLWGRHFIHVSSAKHMVGQFNAHLRDCAFLFADEAFFAGDKQHESTLKTLVTEDRIFVEPKGVDGEQAPNYLHILMSSNQDWVVPAGLDERRFFVLDVGSERKQDLGYFGRIRTALANGGRESLLHFLLTFDLDGYEVRAVPQTAALQAQKLYSLSLEESWWFERLTEGRITHSRAAWETSIQRDHVYADYIRFAEQQRINRRATSSSLGMFLKKVLPGGLIRGGQRVADVEKQDNYGQTYIARERRYFYDLPVLTVARDEWAKHFGHCDWPGEEGGEEPEPELVPEYEPY